MKKKVIVLTLILTSIIVGIIVFSEKVYKIGLIENIKQVIASRENTYIQENGMTKVDVTYLEDNGNLDHEHIIKTMYDENKHWNECIICGQKENETAHSYTDNGWLYGSSCKEGNVHKYSCSCGHSYTTNVGKPNHILGNVGNSPQRYSLERVCENGCGYVNIIHHCQKSNGTQINCGNLGTCSLCGYNFNSNNSFHLAYGQINSPNEQLNEKEINCAKCNTNLGKVNYLRLIRKSTTEYTFQCKVTLASGVNYYNSSNTDMLAGNHNVYNNSTTTGSTCTFERTIKFNEYLENGGAFQVNVIGKKNGMTYQIAPIAYIPRLDEIEPIISKITTTQEQEELTEWSKTKPIIVSGTENYCKSVTVKIIDENENTIFDGKGTVSNDSNYAVSCIPELEVDTNGKTFTAIVTDACGNSTEQKFTIAKVDCIPPNPLSENEILGDWAKSKDFTFIATDYGIGQVKIAFNDIEDLKLATEDGKTYSRDYKFVGDVYKPKQLSVLYKDGLGNTSIQKITIDKIDNTAPTITTNTSIHNNVITVDAHDRHKTLGEGSGVVKYRYLASEEKLANPELTNENSLESINAEITIEDIYKMKYIYIVAEDYVGNTSEVYEFEVPQLILTSSVNLNTADGKGEIILDWSSYDVSDKYFVVYRKKDNQTEWEEIVPLTQKLTGSTYIDKLGNDKAKPNVPAINVTGDATNNNINITANSTDNGTNYKYYIESYDSIGTLISKSK